MKRVYLTSLPIDLAAPDQIIERITGWLNHPEGFYHIVTLNALMVIAAQTNPALLKAIQQADFVTVDGYGVAAAIERQGQQVPSRLPGVAMTQKLLDWCATQSRRLYFYGGTSQTVIKLKDVIQTRWPGLNGSIIKNGYTSEDIRQDIIAWQPDLLLVGLGTPAQEIIIASLRRDLKYTVAVGVGGEF